jgi:hypothetical protein
VVSTVQKSRTAVLQQGIQLGSEENGWMDFNIPTIEIGPGTYINPATVNLDTLSQLVDDLVSPYAFSLQKI